MKHFKEEVSKAKKIAITGHIHPDGDCIGSCLALKQYILDNTKGKSVDVYLEPFSSKFSFLNHADEVIHLAKNEETYDLFFVLDCGSEDRYEPFAKMVKQANVVFGIDHHISNDGFGDFCKIDPDASATCEVLCQIFEENEISKECAQCLYTGIVHDTGVFKHSNTTRKTMEYAGMLLEKGVSSTKIIDETFYQKTFIQNQLLGRALSKSELYEDGKVIFSDISEDDLRETHATSSDSDGIIDQLRITKGVEAAVFVYPLPDGYKVSMRSNELVNVSEIAKSYGGGGHIRAAGCSMNGTLEEIKDKIIGDIKKQL